MDSRSGLPVDQSITSYFFFGLVCCVFRLPSLVRAVSEPNCTFRSRVTFVIAFYFCSAIKFCVHAARQQFEALSSFPALINSGVYGILQPVACLWNSKISTVVRRQVRSCPVVWPIYIFLPADSSYFQLVS